MALGAAASVDVTRIAYRTIGEELSALGITLDFAPVADVNTNPQNPVIGVRSFGDDPRRVAEHVRAAIGGLHDAGVASAAKHFPGHGDASVDSHHELPAIERDASQLRGVEFVPFRAAIAAGVDAIMTGHLALPLVDPSGAPATMSRVLLTDLLRGELGFDGVICTDCMQMDAIASGARSGESAVAAVAAGADLVTFSSSVEAAREAVDALRAAVQDGRLDPGQIERSLARVTALRTRSVERRGADIASVGGQSHRNTALDVARKAITIVRDPASSIPLSLHAGQKIFVVQFDGPSATPAESTGKQTTLFGKSLARSPARVQEQLRTLDPAGHEYKQLLMAAGSADVIIAVARRAWAHRLQALAIADLALTAKPLIVVAVREPYDAAAVPAEAAVIATYGDDDASMEAAADVLLGKHAATGRLPVVLTEHGAATGAGAGAGAAP
jgi:beta-N-acetylhexosaminidase